jgi:1,4-alpha-glucan branching enzyme
MIPPSSFPPSGAFVPLQPLVPKKTLRAMRFICNAPHARAVSLVGDFNAWDPAVHPMTQMPDRAWFLSVELPHGHHRYAFLVDGHLTLDPRAQGIAHNDKGERVSLVPVS